MKKFKTFLGTLTLATILGTTTILATEPNAYLDNITEATTFVDGDEIYITSSGTYEFSGDYTNSTIVVDVDKDIDKEPVYLVLNGANITAVNGTPIHIIEAKDVIIVLEDGTENFVTQDVDNTDTEDLKKAAIYTSADTVITGSGSLTVTTNYRDGINGRDDLIIDGSTITVTAIEEGILGKDLLEIHNANITIEAGNDGLKSSNDTDEDRGNILITSGTFDITAWGDSISAANTLQIDGGDFTLASGGGYVGILRESDEKGGGGGTSVDEKVDDGLPSMKALKAIDIIINGGNFDISAYDDGVNASGDILINGGTFYIVAGDDGMTADNDFTINDINLTIASGFEGLEAATMTINGGTMVIDVRDDGININNRSGYIRIVDVDAHITTDVTGDHIDTNGDFYMEGGHIVVVATNLNIPWMIVDIDGSMEITGGTIVDQNGNIVEIYLKSDQSSSSDGEMSDKAGQDMMANRADIGQDMMANKADIGQDMALKNNLNPDATNERP